jgi:hypothetical protein
MRGIGLRFRTELHAGFAAYRSARERSNSGVSYKKAAFRQRLQSLKRKKIGFCQTFFLCSNTGRIMDRADAMVWAMSELYAKRAEPRIRLP